MPNSKHCPNCGDELTQEYTLSGRPYLACPNSHPNGWDWQAIESGEEVRTCTESRRNINPKFDGNVTNGPIIFP